MSGVITVFFLTQIPWLMSTWEFVYPNSINPTVPPAVCTIIFLAALYKFLPRKYTDKDGVVHKRDMYYYFFCYFAFNSGLTLRFVLHIYGLIDDPFCRLHIAEKEPYFVHSAGRAIILLDCTFLYVLYLIMIHKQDNKVDDINYRLLWSGSLGYAMFLITFMSIGSYGNERNLEVFILNLTYMLPYFYIFKVCSEHKPNSSSLKTKTLSSLDLILMLGLLYSILFSVFHGLGALGDPLIEPYIDNYEPYIKDPAKFGVMHCLVAFFYGMPMQFVLIYGLYHHNTDWLPKLSWFYAGMTWQGTFIYIFAMLSEHTSEQYRVEHAWVVALNALLPIIAFLVALRSNRIQENAVKNK